jgi:hypothetical protein
MVSADANNNRLFFFYISKAVTQRSGFFGSAAGESLWVKEENYPGTFQARQAHVLVIGCHSLKTWGHRPHLYSRFCRHHSLSFRLSQLAISFNLLPILQPFEQNPNADDKFKWDIGQVEEKRKSITQHGQWYSNQEWGNRYETPERQNG